MSKFQIIILAIFVVFIIVGVVAFATYKGNSSGTQLPAISIWGTFPAGVFDQYVSKINLELSQPITIKYTEEDPARFSQDFVAALARGSGPDAILIPADMILPQEDKLALIPYASLSQRTFLDTYVQEALIYLNANGIMALPFSIDPLIMYWNRDMFDSAGIATHPRYWDEFTAQNGLDAKLVMKDQNGNIRKTAIALGDFSNVTNAREILATLLFQIGNPITIESSDGSVTSVVKGSSPVDPTPAIKFFTQFVDPNDPNYSWNRGMPDAKSAFLSGTLATYFGFASELKDLQAKNPNLNFDAALLPQIRPNNHGNSIKSVYARMYGLSLVRASANTGGAFQVIGILTDPRYLPILSDMMYLPTVRRETIAKGSDDAYISIFNQAALVSRTWLDADPTQSRAIFGNMIQSIVSGRKSVYEAMQDESGQYDVVLGQVRQ